VWWVEVAAPGPQQRTVDYLSLLSTEERARWEGIRVERGREEFLLGRALLRTTLSRYVSRRPAEWRFELGERGRPELVGAKEDPILSHLRFNLAHSEGLVACIVASGGDAGIDLEHPQRSTDYQALAERFFSDDERRHFATPSDQEAGRPSDHASENARREAFYSIWTLKEAYLKARGIGIGLPLRSLSFEPEPSTDTANPGRIRASFGAKIEDDPTRWQFDLFRAPTDHLIATALTGDAGTRRPIIARRIVPLSAAPQGAELVPLATSAGSTT
jgi:4'-phosphopantetheinyl transferase